MRAATRPEALGGFDALLSDRCSVHEKQPRRPSASAQSPTPIRRDLENRTGECFTPSGAAFAADGFICESCGFHAVLKTCGRCGARCHRPGEKTND